MQKSLIKITCALLIIGLNWTGFLAIGQTFALFNDIENSNSNTYEAGILNLTVRPGQSNFVPGAEEMSHGDQVNRDIYIGKTAASLPLKHRVSYKLIDGDKDFCNQLDLKIWYDHYLGPPSGGYGNRDMRLTYNGKLSLLNEYTDPDFIIPHSDDQFDIDSSDGTEQWFYYSIIVPNGIDDSFQGKVCNFKFVFEGWQDNIDNYGDGGFSDIEEIESVIKTSYWNSLVVLNEFLPNADNYPEFIELYNNSNSSIDLKNYKIRTDNQVIPITPSVTKRFSNGDTVIPAYGWLVVAAPVAPPNPPHGWDDIMDNSTGTITLYGKKNIVVDSYTYGNPEYNINNNPGWTNNLVAYLPFEDNADDISGNTNDGTKYGATFTSGKIGQGLDFDGIDDYIFVSNSASLNGMSNDITLSAWVKFDTFGSGVNSRILSKDNGNNDWQLRLTDNKATFQIDAGGWNSVSGATDLAINTWYHLVGVYDGSYIRIYVNGVEDGKVSETDSFSGSADNLYIGRNEHPVSQYVDGIIDEVKIYDRALDADEVWEHYNDIGVSGAIPVDKSYARIPDGTGEWIDPIPTPGGFNKLSAEEKAEIFAPAEILYTPIINYTPAVGATIDIPATDNTSTTDDVIDIPATDNASTTDDVIDIPATDNTPTTDDVIDIPATDNTSTTDDIIDIPATDVNSGTTDPVVDIDDVVGVTPAGTEPVEPTDPPAEEEPPAEDPPADEPPAEEPAEHPEDDSDTLED